jgi:glycosyl hydrolase family 26
MRMLKKVLTAPLVTLLVACGNSDAGTPATFGGSGNASAGSGSSSGSGETTGGPHAGQSGQAGGPSGGVGGLLGSAGSASGGSGQSGATAGGVSGSGGTMGSNGGQAGNGGAGSGGASGTGGTGGIPDCTVNPVTPNATAATRKVLCYLTSVYGTHILSGQEEDNSDDGMNTVLAASGKYPAIRAFDVNNSMAPTQCVQHWQQRGGLCMFGYHMGINGGTYSTKTDIDKVLTAGTAENNSFNSDLDRYAQYIQPLQQAGGVALVRLFHEAGKNCSWFWWSMGSSDQYKSLYKYAFNYLTATKGLNNLLWIVPQCGTPDPSYDPGKQYSDFGGADTYVTDTGPLTGIFNQTVSSFPGRPAMLHECGKIPDPDQLKSSNTKWLLFNLWSNPFFHADHNSAAWIKQVYTSDYVITADELPSFK